MKSQRPGDVLAYVISALIPTDVPKTPYRIPEETGYSLSLLKRYLNRLSDLGFAKREVVPVGTTGRGYVYYRANRELLKVDLDELLAKMRGVAQVKESDVA